jgi:predicted RNA binding protein YcfA (HicA-like mRNA interferase family)
MQRAIKPKEILRALLKIGFCKIHQKGSHLRLRHLDGRRVTVSIHNKPLAKGVLASVLRQSKISKEELEEIL